MKYYVTTGNWDLTVSSNDIMEAATLAIEKIYKKKGIFSFGAVTMVWDQESKKIDQKENQYYIYTPTILANAGRYKEADQMKKNIDLLMKSL